MMIGGENVPEDLRVEPVLTRHLEKQSQF
jgi:hypothetical protein